MIKKIILLVIFLSLGIIHAQTKYFPGDLNLQPFAANTLEPKMGFSFRISENNLSLDIGRSVDIFQINTAASVLSLGADFFTFTLLRGEDNFHFPVDAVDYLFGFNFTFKKLFALSEFGARLRISHISAHFADGHFSASNNKWRDGRDPIVYSREFVELTPYYRINGLRFYSGFTYLLHVDPDYLGKTAYQFGFDYFLTGIFSDLVTPFAGYDLKFAHINKFIANNSFVAGIKFGHPFGEGISLYFRYFSGMSIHGEYFNKRVNFSAIGINLDI